MQPNDRDEPDAGSDGPDAADGSEAERTEISKGFTSFGERFDEDYSGAPDIDRTLPKLDPAEEVGPGEAGMLEMPPVPKAGKLPEIPGVTLGAILGVGGQGTVYRGRQTFVDREVAVKVLVAGARASFINRFKREAKLLAGMQHPSVVACYDAGISPGGRCYITMEFIDGPDLAAWIQSSGALGTREALELVRDVARALEYAHAMEVIHRDVKPENVLLQEREPGDGDKQGFRAKLADLGLARVTGDEEGQTTLTVQGSVMGTPATMALEQIDDPDSVDHRADIYGLGCVLYHALAGKSAYHGLRPSQVFKKKAQEPAPDIRVVVPDVPPEVAKLVRCMMEGDRELRPQTYPELVTRIESVLNGLEPGSGPGGVARSRSVWSLVAALLVTLASVFVIWSTSSGDDPVDHELATRTIPDPITREPVGPVEAEVAVPLEQEAGGSSDAVLENSPEEETGDPAAEIDTQEGEVEPLEEPAVASLDPPLQPGTKIVLFEEWSDLDGLLGDWEKDPPGIWSTRDELDRPQARSSSGVATATRPLPEGPWRLTGEVLVQPVFRTPAATQGDSSSQSPDVRKGHSDVRGRPSDSAFWGGFRIGFGADRGLELVAELSGEATSAVWARAERNGQDWELDEPFGAIVPTLERREWVPFRIDFTGRGMRLWIGSDLERPQILELEGYGLSGPATTLTLTAAGTVVWRNFVLAGV